MKKLIVFLAILAMVNVASAGVIDIVVSSLNGQTITPTKEITIMPSDTVDMQITFTAPDTEYAFGLGSIINVTGPATLDISQTVRHADYDSTLELKGTNPPWIVEGGTWLGPQGTGQPVSLVTNLLLHCDGKGLVTVGLMDDPVFGSYVSDAQWNPVDWSYGTGVVIHQVPEPMTLTLLGLGSLFLARRKK